MKDGLLIDTNLLLVMVIGGVDEGRYIEKSKRLSGFCIEDYINLWRLVAEYKAVWITPYIAAEVSNLIDLDGDVGARIFDLAREVFNQFKQIDSSISDDSKGSFFIEFGLTDNSIINLSKTIDIVTNDQRMLTPLYTVSPDRIIPFIRHKDMYG